MKKYEDYSQSPDGWNISASLTLEDDGRFSYGEFWSDYTNASLYGGAEGRWWRDGEAVVFVAESVKAPTHYPWVAGRELRGVVRGDAIDFGHGYTLRVPPEREVNIPVRNNGARPFTVVLEPWGISHVVAPGEAVRVVARGPWGPEGPEIVRGADEVVFYGWSGSRVEVIREPKPPKAATPPRPPAAPAGSSVPKSPAPPPAPAPVVEPNRPPLLPRAPAPELAARIRQWVDETPGEGLRYLCRENGAVWLHSTPIYLWLLRPDGQVLCIDHESFARRAEPENNPIVAVAALAQGAREHPELGELLPPDMAGLRQCERCGGKGWTPSPPPLQGTDYCGWCDGMGWHEPRPAR